MGEEQESPPQDVHAETVGQIPKGHSEGGSLLTAQLLGLMPSLSGTKQKYDLLGYRLLRQKLLMLQ